MDNADSLGFESEAVEFKKSTSELKEGVVSLSSMLNKNGRGTLYFGVKNDGEPIGQKIGGSTLRDISRAIGENIEPKITPKISIELIGDTEIIKIEAEGNNRPYSAYGRYYVRSADEDRALTPSQILELVRSNYDAISEIAAKNQQLTFAMLKTIYAAKGLTVNERTFEDNLGLKNSHGEYNLMAELLADENSVSVKVATFSGKDKTKLININEYGDKCLILAMQQAMDYVDAQNKTAVSLETRPRVEERLFDEDSFHEAWLNACLHTRWEQLNPPAIYIFSDRLEIISTGGLLPNLTEDEFYQGVSRPVNQGLQKIFGQLGLIEQTGHGVPLITEHYGRKAIDIMEHFINVIIPFNPRALGANGDERALNEARVGESEEKVLKILAHDPEATIMEIHQETGLSDSYIKKILAGLREKGLVRRVGANKNGRWEVYANPEAEE